jgi:N-acetyl-gamma-glutamyl-phosphate reductase
MKAALVGTTGYTGQILLRLLGNHPHIDTIIPGSSSKAGADVLSIDSGLNAAIKKKMTVSNGNLVPVEKIAAFKPDVVFAALPHLTSGAICKQFFSTSIVIDLSADFRIKDPVAFEHSYGSPPPCPEELPRAAYGLCEVYEDEIKKSDIIANPGCYPTATLLPLYPLIRSGLITGKIIVNSLSGISGAGKKAKENLLFCERSENTGAYSPGKSHRHTGEIQQGIDWFSREPKGTAEVFFTPHLVPLKRGMAVTTTADLSREAGTEEIATLFEEVYGSRPFVKLNKTGVPQSLDVWGSNRCDIGWHCEGDTLFLFSAIDNLVKGASGQAVQNMNIRFGIEETAGLPVWGEV